MQLPTSLNIVGREVPIIVVDVFPEQLGEYNYDDYSIKIKSGQHPLAEADTLLHECIHAIDDCFQLKMSERQVYCLAVGVLALLRDNKSMMPYLTEAIEKPRNI
jgi:hypothetical protein